MPNAYNSYNGRRRNDLTKVKNPSCRVYSFKDGHYDVVNNVKMIIIIKTNQNLLVDSIIIWDTLIEICLVAAKTIIWAMSIVVYCIYNHALQTAVGRLNKNIYYRLAGLCGIQCYKNIITISMCFSGRKKSMTNHCKYRTSMIFTVTRIIASIYLLFGVLDVYNLLLLFDVQIICICKPI